MLTDTHADNQGAALPGSYQSFRPVFIDDTQCVGAFNLHHGVFYRREQVSVALQVVMDLIDGNLRIRFRCERVAGARLFCPERLVILNNAIMYQGNFIFTDVRVGVIDTGTAMGSPAGMGKTGIAVQGRCADGLNKFIDLALYPQAVETRSFIQYYNTGGIVPAILQAPQPFQQNRRNIPFRNRADNSAHYGLTAECCWLRNKLPSEPCSVTTGLVMYFFAWSLA